MDYCSPFGVLSIIVGNGILQKCIWKKSNLNSGTPADGNSEYERSEENIEVLNLTINVLDFYFKEGYIPDELLKEIIAKSAIRYDNSFIDAITGIPPGTTISYCSLAERLGKPAMTRGLGRILALNDHVIIIPCHRIIRRNGTIGGYNGGTDIKEALLQHELR
ncbi:MAG: MGMT family protein [Muribaculaceae bacterium]|nr:MGMT family protein [Muribaculaceae bacterium]